MRIVGRDAALRACVGCHQAGRCKKLSLRYGIEHQKPLRRTTASLHGRPQTKRPGHGCEWFGRAAGGNKASRINER
jgi:hypothetical protein